jgi:hypothetical protein
LEFSGRARTVRPLVTFLRIILSIATRENYRVRAQSHAGV